MDGYVRCNIGSATCAVPYFNNKSSSSRAALRTYIGKGDPRSIIDEARAQMIKSHISPDTLDGPSLKRLLIEAGLGIDCSGLAYHILDAESRATGHDALSKRISYVNCSGIISKMRCALRPVENCDVATLADETNSGAIDLAHVLPGDMMIMLGARSDDPATATQPDRDHMLVIHRVDYHDDTPSILHYVHAIAYPEDGIYGTGARTGTIEIVDPSRSILKASWIEEGRTGDDNRIFARAKGSETSIRRLR